MNSEEILLNVQDAFKNWALISEDDATATLAKESEPRLRAWLQISRRLQHFYPNPVHQREWWSRPNAALSGEIPAEFIQKRPENLLWISYVLESAQFLADGV